MRFLLNLSYLVLAILLVPWLLYAALTKGKYRQGWWVKLTGRVPWREGEAPCVWMHAVSVGEVMLLVPVLRQFQARFPGWQVVVTTTTQTGFELARRRFADSANVYYCPLDFSWGVEQMLRRIRPRLLVLAELELWPNLISAARRHGTKVVIVNGRLGESSFRGYQRIGWLVGSMLRRIDLIAAQEETYAQRFRTLGALDRSVHVTGSIKFDGARSDRQHAEVQRLARLWNIEKGDVVFLAGSTQEPEEAIALEVFQRLSPQFPRLRMIVTPRHAERFAEVASLLDASGVAWQRRTELREHSEETCSTQAAFDKTRNTIHDANAAEARPAGERVLLVDTIGELSCWWGVSDIAFVGGSLGSRGGQNMIEPAGFGAAVCFGPNTRNFRDVVQCLRQAEAAEVVHDAEELQDFLRRCIESEAYRRELGDRARQVVQQQQGATRRTMDLVSALLSEQPC